MYFAKWDVTGKCNLRCKHCSVGKTYDLGNQRFEDLNTEEMLEIADKLIKGKVMNVQILGGEPFIRKDLLMILRKLSKGHIRMLINTNGHLLTKDIIRELAKLNIEVINFSFDGANAEINDLIRGKGSFAKTLTKLKETMQIIEENNSDIKVGVNFVLTKYSLGRAKELVNFCIENNIKYLAVTDLWITENAEENQDCMAVNLKEKIEFHEELSELISKVDINLKSELTPLSSGYFNYKYKTRFQTLSKCYAGKKIIYIQADGRVYPCIKCRENSEVIGEYFNQGLGEIKKDWNLINNNLEDIFKSEYFEKFKEFVEIDRSNDSNCKECIYFEYCTPCPFTYREKGLIEECAYVKKIVDKL